MNVYTKGIYSNAGSDLATAQLQQYLDSVAPSGTLIYQNLDGEIRTYIRVWPTTEAANQFIAFMQTLDVPPDEISIIEYTPDT